MNNMKFVIKISGFFCDPGENEISLEKYTYYSSQIFLKSLE